MLTIHVPRATALRCRPNGHSTRAPGCAGRAAPKFGAGRKDCCAPNRPWRAWRARSRSFEPVVMAVRAQDVAEAQACLCGARLRRSRLRWTIPGRAILGRHFWPMPKGARPQCNGSSTHGATNIIRMPMTRASPPAQHTPSIRSTLFCAAGVRGRRNPQRRRGHVADDRTVPAQPESQSASDAASRSRRGWRCSPARAASSGWATGFRTKRPTAMSTTSPVSRAPGRVIVGVPSSRSHPDYEPVMDALSAAEQCARCARAQA